MNPNTGPSPAMGGAAESDVSAEAADELVAVPTLVAEASGAGEDAVVAALDEAVEAVEAVEALLPSDAAELVARPDPGPGEDEAVSLPGRLEEEAAAAEIPTFARTHSAASSTSPRLLSK